MSKKIFFASAAKVAFALAAVVMMSAAFTACSKDNDDDNPPAPKTQIVVLDGTEKTIVKVECKDWGQGNYELYLYMDSKESMRINFNKDRHVTGNPINLTKKEAEQGDKLCWVLVYYKSNGHTLLTGNGYPDSNGPGFNEGTLTMSGSPDENINIQIENGRIMGEDNVEHTLTLNYSGKMNKIGKPTPKPDPKPKANIVTLDGEEKPIVKAEYKDEGHGNYRLYLNLSADGKEKVQMDLNKDLHITNTPIDLKKKEEKHNSSQWHWAIMYYSKDGGLTINTYANPAASGTPVFKTGTLTATGNPATGTISIKLENGSVVGKDKKEYTLTLSYSGSITKQQ